MEVKPKITIVEDEMIIAANISLQLTELGYEVTGILPRGAEAILHIKQENPDLVLMDINLKGTLNGIETTRLLHKEINIPIIYLTANSDEHHFNEAKTTNPYAFISKPFKKIDLQHAIQLTLNRVTSEKKESPEQEEAQVLKDAIFIRNNDKMVKISISEILYLEADRNYCKIFTLKKEHLIVSTLKDLESKLPKEHFLRVHRSYVVNLSKIDEVAISHLNIVNKAIPISKSYKEDLLKRLQTL